MKNRSAVYMTPQQGEYHPYYETYVSLPDEDILPYLEEQGDSFATLIRSIPEAKWSFRYAEGKWSVKELMSHILDGERIFVYRALAIARGEKNPLPGFDENAYVDDGTYDHRTAESYYREFVSIRRATIDFFRYLHETDWPKSRVVNGNLMSVRAIAYIIGGHLSHHMSVLNERYLG